MYYRDRKKAKEDQLRSLEVFLNGVPLVVFQQAVLNDGREQINPYVIG